VISDGNGKSMPFGFFLINMAAPAVKRAPRKTAASGSRFGREAQLYE
jgi:hypothetical protein